MLADLAAQFRIGLDHAALEPVEQFGGGGGGADGGEARGHRRARHGAVLMATHAVCDGPEAMFGPDDQIVLVMAAHAPGMADCARLEGGAGAVLVHAVDPAPRKASKRPVRRPVKR